MDTDVAGAFAVFDDVNEITSEDLARAETISMPIVVLLALLIFGSLVAASMPALVGLLAMVGALALVRLITGFTEVSVFSVNVISLLGIGLAIDYALFVISRFREETRETRIKIAEEAQTRYGRKVSWGARSGEVGELFTHLSVPVMTRLRQPERQVLDTLVDAGVARSRSEALAWAVTLVGEHTETWLSGLRDAMSEVDKLRSQGPEL